MRSGPATEPAAPASPRPRGPSSPGRRFASSGPPQGASRSAGRAPTSASASCAVPVGCPPAEYPSWWRGQAPDGEARRSGAGAGETQAASVGAPVELEEDLAAAAAAPPGGGPPAGGLPPVPPDVEPPGGAPIATDDAVIVSPVVFPNTATVVPTFKVDNVADGSPASTYLVELDTSTVYVFPPDVLTVNEVAPRDLTVPFAVGAWPAPGPDGGAGPDEPPGAEDGRFVPDEPAAGGPQAPVGGLPMPTTVAAMVAVVLVPTTITVVPTFRSARLGELTPAAR